MMEWDGRTKAEIKAVLKPEFTSPEKTDSEADPEGPKTRVRQRFEWESSRLSNRKADLDDAYYASLSADSKKKTDLVIDSRGDHDMSKSPPPQNAPEWAISRRYSKK